MLPNNPPPGGFGGPGLFPDGGPRLPGGQGGDVNTTMPMVLSILSTLLCCLPLGIVGIVFASQASTAISTGDYETARSSAKKSMTAALVAMGLGIMGYIAVIAMNVIGSRARQQLP